MSTIGDRLGKGARLDTGVGVPIAPKDLPVESDLFYTQWQRGLVTSESPENIGDQAAQVMTDVEVDPNDALIVAPGVTLDQDATPRSMRYIFQQSNVNYATELVVIDPPWVGYKGVGAFTFNNLGIAATNTNGWAAISYLGTLLFSNGVNASYTRAPNSNTVTNVSADIIAQTFATAFGRVFAGAFVDPITGLQSLAISWNAANGSLTDWTGLGSGAEFLISNNSQADRIVAIVPLGLQTMGILCRNSLWAGYETQVSNRPADFQQRFLGMGCVSAQTAVATPYGVVYLSDDGVCLYDLNSVQVISHAINGLLIPLNYVQLGSYSAVYDAELQRYILSTPAGIYIYQFPQAVGAAGFATGDVPARWMFRSFIPDSMITFTSQNGNVYWNTVQGMWNQQTLAWDQMSIGQQNAPALVYFGKGTKLGYQDYTATTNLGTALTPMFESRQDSKEVTALFETHWFEVQYKATVTTNLVLTTTDVNGALTQSITKSLVSTGGTRKRVIFGVSTMCGMGTELQVQLASGLAIERIRRVILPDGPSVSVTI